MNKIKLYKYLYPLDNCNNLLRSRICNKQHIMKITNLVLRYPNNNEVNVYVISELDKIQIKYKIKDVYRKSCYIQCINEEYD